MSQMNIIIDIWIIIEYHKLFDTLIHNDKENNKYILQS